MRMTMKTKNKKEILHLLIGFYSACILVARLQNLKRYKIIVSPEELLGYHGPLIIHLCYGFTRRHNWLAFINQINRMRTMDKYGELKLIKEYR